jgi:diguanylate cyclase (GGDEF)-like protein/PAS domain S-box-containing protein
MGGRAKPDIAAKSTRSRKSPLGEAAAELRSGAEERLACHPEFTLITPDMDAVRLVHELQVHQAELEMRNQSLQEACIGLEDAERKLREREDQLRIFVEHAPAAIAMLDDSLCYLAVSRRWKRDWGLGGGEWLSCAHDLALPNLPGRWKNLYLRALDGESIEVDEDSLVQPDGSVRWFRWQARPWHDADGAVGGIILMSEDITGRKAAEAQTRIAAVAFEARDAMLVTDAQGVILRVNRSFSEITGYSAEEAVGKTPGLLRSGRHDPNFYRTLWEAVAREGHWEGEIWNRRKDGGLYAAWLSISAVRDEAGTITHYLGVSSNISEPREAERKIRELAFYDPLTGLPNRRLMLDRLHQAVSAGARSRQYGAVLLIDLDHFKLLNDTRGHQAGDEFLVEAARRLRAALRDSDSAARLGGDEYAVLLEDLHQEPMAAANIAENIAEKLRAAIAVPVALDGEKEHRITASVGIVLFGGPDETAGALWRQADLALYEAKSAGRDAVRFYSSEMQAAVDARAEMEAALRQALERNELRLHYQPKVELRGGRVVGAEALIRWHRPLHGMVPPADFIPLAEETGLIVPIGEWVIGAACEQLKAWQDEGLPDVSVAVNVSARQFQQGNLSRIVAQALRLNGVAPERLVVELTESAVMRDPDQAARALTELKAIGVHISLDDFGTGYSSLGYLKRFPIDSLKIDRSFVRDVTSDPDDAAIAQTIIALAHSLNQKVVAEGVETEAQLRFLRAKNCDEMQGYLFSRPLEAGAFADLLREGRRLSAPANRRRHEPLVGHA